MKLWQKKTIETILKEYQKNIQKGLGQNYLLDHNILTKIAKYVRMYPPDHTVVEIGPGLGGLTQTILEENTHRLVAVEIDPISCTILEDLFFKQNHFPESWRHRLQIFHRDIYGFDLEEHAQPPFVFIGNLPYHTATFIIIELLERYKDHFSGGVFMIQKEVAERLTAQTGDGAYSLITVITSAIAEIKKIAYVPPSSFYPSPKVDSALIHILPRKNPFDSLSHYLVYKTIAKAAFRHRRKQFINSIRLTLRKPETLLATTDREKIPSLDLAQVERAIRDYPLKRAEDLTPQEYIEIARKITGG